MKNRFYAFVNAFNGLIFFFKETVHARIHAFAALVVVLFGLYFQLNSLEWVSVLLCIGLVLSLEAVNSAIEYTVDLASPAYNELAKKAKDVAAAAVLLATIFSVIIAGLIFIPKIVSS